MKNSILLSESLSRLAADQMAKFIVPDWGDKVDSSLGLSYHPARLQRLAGRYDIRMPESPIWTWDYEFGNLVQKVKIPMILNLRL
jgi:hypothetical protein